MLQEDVGRDLVVLILHSLGSRINHSLGPRNKAFGRDLVALIVHSLGFRINHNLGPRNTVFGPGTRVC